MLFTIMLFLYPIIKIPMVGVMAAIGSLISEIIGIIYSQYIESNNESQNILMLRSTGYSILSIAIISSIIISNIFVYLMKDSVIIFLSIQSLIYIGEMVLLILLTAGTKKKY